MTEPMRPSPADRPIRVCIVAPSLSILGGQAVAAQRLLERLRAVPGLEVDFMPHDPRSNPLLRLLQRVKYVRTVVTSAVYVASLLNLSAVVEAVRAADEDAVVVCAGVQGTMNLDDTFVAGRIVELLGWERTDAAEAAARLVGTWADAEEAFRASKSGRNLMENAPELEDDIPFCARESVLDVVPRLVAMRDGAAEIAL